MLSIYFDYVIYDGLIDRMMYFSVFIFYSLILIIDVNIREIFFIILKFVMFFLLFFIEKKIKIEYMMI